MLIKAPKPRAFRAIGKHEAKCGLPIDNFYRLPYKRLTEAMRAEYEIGWLAYRAENPSSKPAARGRPVTNHELHRIMRGQGVSRTTAYKILKKKRHEVK